MGRGLAAILPTRDGVGEPALREIAVDLIRPNADQPRKEFGGEALIALSESIKARGVLQPHRRAAAAGWLLRADCRRAPPARGADGWARADTGDSCATPRTATGSSSR